MVSLEPRAPTFHDAHGSATFQQRSCAVFHHKGYSVTGANGVYYRSSAIENYLALDTNVHFLAVFLELPDVQST